MPAYICYMIKIILCTSLEGGEVRQYVNDTKTFM
jgi:hypothetical protein